VGLLGNEEQLNAVQKVLATPSDGGKRASRPYT
jgi:hypothetical protein